MITEILRRNRRERRVSGRAAALDSGGRDNVTAIVAIYKVPEDPPSPTTN